MKLRMVIYLLRHLGVWIGKRLADAFDKPEWKTDPRFLNSSGLEEYKDERLEMTQTVLKTETTEFWIDRLTEYDVPHAPVLTRREMIRHPQIVANQLVTEHDHPLAGRLRQTRPPTQFDGTPSGIPDGWAGFR